MGLSGPIPIADYERKRDRRPSRKTDSSRILTTPSVLEPPDWLEGVSLECFTRTVADANELGLPIHHADLNLYTRYACMWADWRVLRAEYERCDKIVADVKYGGEKKTPLFSQYKAMAEQLLKMEQEMGFTSKARQRIGKAQVDDTQDDGLLD